VGSATPAFDAGSLQRRYAFLDECPEALLAQVVTLPVGDLQERVIGARRWHDDLLAGRLPALGDWPPPPVADPVRRALASMDLPRFCKDDQELVTALMGDVLAAFARGAVALRDEVAQRLRALEELERLRLEEEENERARLVEREALDVELDEGTLEQLRHQAQRDIEQLEREADAELRETWGERARAWAAISEVFGDLGQLLGRGWDLARSVLRHAGWLELLRLRELVERLPELREIVRTLGRLQESDDEPSVTERVFVPVQRIDELRIEHETPHMPAETRGVVRGGEIDRMLPVEAATLGHPRLRMLWHARRAERALMVYKVRGVDLERVLVEREDLEEFERERPRPVRGPIIAVLDTSGSMHGVPERVAKALVLEALRTAHAERRRCFLYAHSGPGQILEYELELSPDGLGRLLAFLGMSFGGGTDVSGVGVRVVERLEREAWEKADVIWVSDGEFPVGASLQHAVARAREAGTRFHGVQIGNRGRTGLHAICEPVHVFQDWVAVGRG
jgi:uncharacterized protein with von Willebrand factor type A (vWA) domain